MLYKSLLGMLLLTQTASLMVANEPTAFKYTKRTEIKASEFVPVALDIQAGALYFTVDGTNLFYKPDAESAATRISTITGLLAELRHARLVVFTYSDQSVKAPERYPGEIFFPAYAPVKDGALYRPVGGFWLQY
ncbi:MAG TPA: hypothetical protein VK961_16805 [Chthoniobacter sp.]|nr:hypothetical protein [Chthoniobacter sp.]